jgi:hypothetical protein
MLAMQPDLLLALEPHRQVELSLAWERDARRISRIGAQGCALAAAIRVGARCIVRQRAGAGKEHFYCGRVQTISAGSEWVLVDVGQAFAFAMRASVRIWPEDVDEALAAESGVRD